MPTAHRPEARAPMYPILRRLPVLNLYLVPDCNDVTGDVDVLTMMSELQSLPLGLLWRFLSSGGGAVQGAHKLIYSCCSTSYGYRFTFTVLQ